MTLSDETQIMHSLRKMAFNMEVQYENKGLSILINSSGRNILFSKPLYNQAINIVDTNQASLYLPLKLFQVHRIEY